MSRAALCIALFGATFFGVALAIRPFVPLPESHYLRVKLEHFAEHGDEYDLVYVGSSRVFHSFDPELIDGELARAGFPLRSFNLGVDGMRAFEADQVLADVLALEPKRLRWAVVEWPQWETEQDTAGNVFTNRVVRWHTLPRTLDVLAALDRLDLTWKENLLRRWQHLVQLGANATNYGTVASALKPDSFHEVERERIPAILAARGFAASREERHQLDPEVVRKRLRAFLDRLPVLQRANEVAVDPERYHADALLRQVATLEEAGVNVIYVTLPGRVPSPHAYRLRSEGFGRPLLLFNDPSRFANLYDIDLRVDTEHLNREGAEVFSRVFAGELATILRNQ